MQTAAQRFGLGDIHRAHLRLRREELGERGRVRARPFHAQRQGLRAGREMVRLLRGQRAAPVAQPFLAHLRDSP